MHALFPARCCLPSATRLPSSLTRAEEERGSAVKWAVLQALLARGLRHLGGGTFRQLPVLLTQLGDELLQVGSWLCTHALLPFCMAMGSSLPRHLPPRPVLLSSPGQRSC